MIVKLALVLVRLFAIYYFMTIVYFVPSMVLNIVSDDHLDLHSLTVLWQFLICFLLFTYPRVVLIGLRIPTDNAGVDDTFNVGVFQSAGIALIGLGAAMYGLEGLINYQFQLWMSSTFSSGGRIVTPEQIATFWSSVFEVAAGVFLIAISGRISGLFTWLRELKPNVHSGREEKADN